MVGSILTTVDEGQKVKRADELGYFAFGEFNAIPADYPRIHPRTLRLHANGSGGSTIILLFEKGVVQWDDDLLANGRASIETLVRMGMGIGKSTKKGLQT